MRTILPKKWVINREGFPEVIDWCNKNSQNNRDDFDRKLVGWYFHYPIVNSSHTYYGIWNGYEEISFEEFKVLILGEKIEPSYEIY